MKNNILSKFEVYRNEAVFSLSTSQHGAISLLCERIMEHIGSTNSSNKNIENILSKSFFIQRYKTLFKRSTASTDDTDKQLVDFLMNNITIIRNYFSHYSITCFNIESFLTSDTFCKFSEGLQAKALLLWKEQHSDYRLDEERKTQFHEMNMKIFENIDTLLSAYFQSEFINKSKKFKPSYFFIFLSIFATKGEMFRLCNSLHKLKINTEKDTDEEKNNKKNYKEILTILSLKESYDVFAENENYIVAMTVLNHFAVQFGYVKNQHGISLKKEPTLPNTTKEQPDICKYHSAHFFLKMAIAFIETNKLLPNIQFARYGDYKLGSKNKERIQPSWDDKDKKHEIFIRNNSVPIRIQFENEYKQGQLGISIIKFVLQTWLCFSDNSEKQKQFLTKFCQSITSIMRTDIDSILRNKSMSNILPTSIVNKEKSCNAQINIKQRIESKKNLYKMNIFQRKLLCTKKHIL